MDRRRVIAITAATAATTLAAAAAVAANFGLLRSGPASSTPLGRLEAGRPAVVTASSAPNQPAPDAPVRYEDIFVRVPPASSAPATPAAAGEGSPAIGTADSAAVPVGTAAGDREGRSSDDHDPAVARSGQSGGGEAEEDD